MIWVLVHEHKLQLVTSGPPSVSVLEPCEEPKLLPKMRTYTPLPVSPPVPAPTFRSVKLICGAPEVVLPGSVVGGVGDVGLVGVVGVVEAAVTVMAVDAVLLLELLLATRL